MYNATVTPLISPPQEIATENISRKARTRGKPLSRAERGRIDTRTAVILEQRGVRCRQPLETVLRDVDDGEEIVTSGLQERWASAATGGRRAAALALEFDAFRQSADLAHLREVSLRPKGRKAAPGELASELRRFADDYNRHIGRLVTKGLIRPILTVVHVRFAQDLGLWDIHAHCLWIVEPLHKDDVIKGIQTKFSKTWIGNSDVKKPGALANYILSGVFDYKSIRQLPEDQLEELWRLPPFRFVRPAGVFAEFRRGLRGKALRRDGGSVVIEDKEPKARKATKQTPTRPLVGERVVAVVKARIRGLKRVCEVVKRPRQHLGPADIKPDVKGCDSAMGLVYEPTMNTSLTPQPEVGSITPTVRQRCFVLPTRKAWWLKAWPNVADQVQEPIRRRILRLKSVAPNANQDRPGADAAPPSPAVERLLPSTWRGHRMAIILHRRQSRKGIP